MRRRHFLKAATASAAGLALGAGCVGSASSVTNARTAMGTPGDDRLYGISLAERSLRRTLRAGEIDHLDFPQVARQDFGIDAVEYASVFFDSTADGYVRELRARAEEQGVRSLLVAVNGEGRLGAADGDERNEAVENHKRWIKAARALGCHSIRAEVRGEGAPGPRADRTAGSLRRLCEYAESYDTNILVENRTGLSSDGAWLASVVTDVRHPLIGTLPDFGNFCLEWEGQPRESDCAREYDPYQGIGDLMPWAEAVNATSFDFDDAGDETRIDYRRMMEIVLSYGYRGPIGIEWAGDTLSEAEGIRATKRLLERVRRELVV